MKKVLLLLISMLIGLMGCASKERRYSDQTILQQIDRDYALVSFVQGDHRRMAYLWDRDQFLGFMSARSILQVKLSPGTHQLIANAGRRYDFLEANLEAGKHYIISIEHHRLAGAGFVPIDGRQYPHKVRSWFDDYLPIVPQPYMKRYYQEKREQALRQAISDYRLRHGRIKQVLLPSGFLDSVHY